MSINDTFAYSIIVIVIIITIINIIIINVIILIIMTEKEMKASDSTWDWEWEYAGMADSRWAGLGLALRTAVGTVTSVRTGTSGTIVVTAATVTG